MGVFQQRNHEMGGTPSSPQHTHTHTHTHTHAHTHTHTHTHTMGNPKKYIYFILHQFLGTIHSIFHVHLLLTVINEYEHVTLMSRIGPFML